MLGLGFRVRLHLLHGDALHGAPGQTRNHVWQGVLESSQRTFLNCLSQLAGPVVEGGAGVEGGWVMEPG